VIDGVSSVFNIIADSGGTRTAYINLVPNGGSPSLGNRVTSTLTIPANTRITSLATLNLEQGDFINFNIDVGDPSQSIWFKVIELEV
jgi:hypothetical protein